MKLVVIKSYLRSLLAAVIAGLGVVLTTSADITLKGTLIAIGGAVVPVLVRWLDSSDQAFGRGVDQG